STFSAISFNSFDKFLSFNKNDNFSVASISRSLLYKCRKTYPKKLNFGGLSFYKLLHINQAFVKTILCDQIQMCTNFNDLPSFQYDNLICILDRTQSVCNNNRCPVLHQLVQRILNQTFRLGIQS